jgi:hypothetical protein
MTSFAPVRGAAAGAGAFFAPGAEDPLLGGFDGGPEEDAAAGGAAVERGGRVQLEEGASVGG